MESYYVIIKSWWEIFPSEKYGYVIPKEKIRVKRRISYFSYPSYKIAHKVAIEIRKNDPHYRYDLGDRIYVKLCERN